VTANLPVWAIIAATLITALGGISAIRSLILVPADRKKIVADVHQAEASAVKMFGDAATVLVAPLTERVKDLENRERAAQSEIVRLNAEVDRLSSNENTELKRLRTEVQRLTLELTQIRTHGVAGNQPPAGEAP
jgi:hypothetical protein